MKLIKSLTPMGWSLLGMVSAALTTGVLLVSCSPQRIPTAPPLSTNTPTVTKTSTITQTPTSTPTITNTPNATQTVAATESMIPTSTATSTPTNTPTATVTATPPSGLGPGSIAFTGLLYNGNSQVSFVNTVALPGSQVVYFTNYSYDPTNSSSPIAPWVDESYSCCATETGNGLTIIEGTVSYTAPAGGLPAYSQIVFGKTGTVAQGTAANVAGASGNTYLVFNHNGNGHKVIAFAVSGPVTTFLAGIIFGPDSWTSSGSVTEWWDSYLPPGLDATTSIDLSGLWANDSLNADEDVGLQNDNAILDSCQNTLAGIVNPLNWVADGDQSKTAVDLNPVGPAPTGACSSGSGGYTGALP